MISPHTGGAESTKRAKFKKHLPFESATTLSEAKYLASDEAESRKYKYRATARLQGNVHIKVGELIYLDGLAHSMSGYWSVIEANHLFNSGNAAYLMDVVLGADVLGDSTESPNLSSGVRDFSEEVSGQSMQPGSSTLLNYDLAINQGKEDTTLMPTPSFKNSPTSYAPAASTTYAADIYKDEIPDFSAVRRTTSWASR